jgi:cysteinyl-tRNA synthetase
MLHLYNTLTRTKEKFIPITPGKIGMYVCGNTVYDHCHLGHARSMVCFDVIVRFLRSEGYDVTYVRNITDIDDKIITRALERGISIETLTNEQIQAQNDDAVALNILPPDLEPRATESIPEIIKLIQRLIETEFAYVIDDGDVCYDVSRFEGYGKLSRKKIEDLEAGARVEVVQSKRSPLDFVLWKKAKVSEPSWPSPWGEGRPGWHIECSAMAMNALGEQFDIHGGGLDLQFPHHENEIAQSEACTHKPFANYWLHVGMLQVNNEKMAKSVGNFMTIKTVLENHHPEVIRYFLLSSHYRSPLNYSEANFDLASKALTRLYQCIRDVQRSERDGLDEGYVHQFKQAMNDDFNTPIALSVLFQLSHDINKEKSPRLAATLSHLAGTLGLLQSSPDAFLKAGVDDEVMIQALVDERLQAKLERNFTRADELRKTLSELSVELEDSATNTVWRIIK